MPDEDDRNLGATDGSDQSGSNEEKPDLEAEYPPLGYQTEGYEPKRKERRGKEK